MLLSVPLVYLMDASLPAILFLVGITVWGGFLPPEGYWYWPVAALIVPHLLQAARREPSGVRTRLLFWVVALVLPFAATVTLSDTWHALWMPTASSMFAFLYLAGRFWPGPLTLVVPAHPGLPANLSPLSTVGVRMPDHPLALALLRRTGPLAVTSANISGQPSARTAGEVYAQLNSRIPLILDGGIP
jgi:hypothetical protein